MKLMLTEAFNLLIDEGNILLLLYLNIKTEILHYLNIQSEIQYFVRISEYLNIRTYMPILLIVSFFIPDKWGIPLFIQSQQSERRLEYPGNC